MTHRSDPKLNVSGVDGETEQVSVGIPRISTS